MEYHKIQTVFKRDMENNPRALLEGEWTLPEFEFLANNTWQFTEKVDGTNIRVYYTYNNIIDQSFVDFQGRTNAAQIPAKLFQTLNSKFTVEKIKNIFTHKCIVLYGEGYGSGIQKAGKLYNPNQDFVLFDVLVYSSDNNPIYLRREDVEDVANQLKIDVVPIIGEGTLYDAIDLVKSGFNSTWGDFKAEGIVARPKVEMFDRMGNRIITKIKCRDFN